MIGKEIIDMEEAAVRVITVLLEENAPMEDIIHLSGKSEEFIKDIKDKLKEE